MRCDVVGKVPFVRDLYGIGHSKYNCPFVWYWFCQNFKCDATLIPLSPHLSYALSRKYIVHLYVLVCNKVELIPTKFGITYTVLIWKQSFRKLFSHPLNMRGSTSQSLPMWVSEYEGRSWVIMKPKFSIIIKWLGYFKSLWAKLF